MPGVQIAKPVIVVADGRSVMLVIPASHVVQMSKLVGALAVDDVRLAEEREFESSFSDCEPGAPPPFGNLYGFDVYVDRARGTTRSSSGRVPIPTRYAWPTPILRGW